MQAAVDRTDRFMVGIRLPAMEQPGGMGTAYTFPDNAAALPSHELGTLQLKLSGWYTWLMQLRGREVAELGALESVYEIALGLAMEETQKVMWEEGSPKVISREVLKARAIKSKPELDRMAKLIIEKQMRVKRLDTQADIYNEQITRLSREQSRREAEARR